MTAAELAWLHGCVTGREDTPARAARSGLFRRIGPRIAMPAIRPGPPLQNHPPRHTIAIQSETCQGPSVNVSCPLSDLHRLVAQPPLQGVSRSAPSRLANLRGIDSIDAQLATAPAVSGTHPHGVTIKHPRDFGTVCTICRTGPCRRQAKQPSSSQDRQGDRRALKKKWHQLHGVSVPAERPPFAKKLKRPCNGQGGG